VDDSATAVFCATDSIAKRAGTARSTASKEVVRQPVRLQSIAEVIAVDSMIVAGRLRNSKCSRDGTCETSREHYWALSKNVSPRSITDSSADRMTR
jgi:hypothetical protein